jgi:hypothetical protein
MSISIAKTPFGQVDLLADLVATIKLLHTSPPLVLQETSNPPFNFDTCEDFVPFIFSVNNLRAFFLVVEVTILIQFTL